MKNSNNFSNNDFIPYDPSKNIELVNANSLGKNTLSPLGSDIKAPKTDILDQSFSPVISKFETLENLNNALYADEFNFSVFFKPILKLVEIEYSDWITAKISDYPPTPPIVNFFPIKDVSNRFNISLSPSSGEITQFPVIIRQSDLSFFNDLLNQQKSQDGKIVFKYEGGIDYYEMFRIENAPINWKSFIEDKTSVNKIFKGYENFLFQETVEPNKEYFYMFRTYDFHYNLSNPSPIYKVKLYENDGVEYLDIKSFEFKVPKKVTSKVFKKFIKVNTSLEQQTFAESNENTQGKLGLYEQSVYNQEFVVRIKSKHTGKCADIIIKFIKEDVNT